MNFYKKIAIWPLILSPLVVFVSFNDAFYPYIATKILFWSILNTISSIGIIGLIFYSTDYRDQFHKRTVAVFKNRFFIATLLFLCSMIISAVMAYEPFIAWVGNFVRWEGVIFFLLLHIYFFYLVILFNKKDWEYFFKVSFFSFAGVLLATLAQGIASISVGTRPDIFIGNPIFSAQYFLLAGGFLLVYLTSNSKKKYAISITIAIFSGIIVTQSRGVVVGFIVAVLFTLLYLLAKPLFLKNENKHTLTRKKIILVLVLLIVPITVFLYTRSASVWQKVPIVKRFAGQELFGNTTESRIITIKSSVRSINPKNEGIKRLFFGWGNENYQFAWSKYYNPEIYKFDKAPFDRAHNKYLDILVMQGIIGLVVYISYLFLFIKQAHSIGGLASIVTIALIIGYAVQNVFAFESFTSYMYLTIIASYLLSTTRNE